MLQAKSQPVRVMTGIPKKKGLAKGRWQAHQFLGPPFIPYLNFVKCVKIQITLRRLEKLILHDSSDRFILHN
jgi:hypothetical protein